MLIKSLLTPLAFCTVISLQAQVNDPNQVARDAATNHANADMNNAAEKGANKAEQSVSNLFKKKNKQADSATSASAKSKPNPTDAGADASAQSGDPGLLKVYQNYDFVPGEKIIFEDNFASDQNGEFPAHWKLNKGQAVVNTVDGKPSFLLTDGNYVEVAPRMKTDKYIDGDFTLEYDFIYKPAKDGGYGADIRVEFHYIDKDGNDADVPAVISTSEMTIGELNKPYPAALSDAFGNKWHHAAFIWKNGQMKGYIDQYRLVVNPNVESRVSRIVFNGIGDEEHPLIFTNVKLALGGGMNVVGQKFTDSKIVTHGINFDIDKSTIRPESMGTINMIAQILRDNPAIKFEIGGHTDNSGTPAHNLTLSQQRADAVKAQLTGMGIDAGRLSAKGYGDTKPLSDNSTLEGKANNRRVEFTKL